MEWNPNEQKAPLIAEAWYVALCVKADSQLTRKQGLEMWLVHYKLLAVLEANDKNEADAQDCVGAFITDRLIDASFHGAKWDAFLPAMFSEEKKAGQEVKLFAKQCKGKVIAIRIGHGKGNQDRGESEKISRVYGYKLFEGNLEQFKEQIAEALPDEAEAAPSGDDDFGGQF